MNWQLVNGNFSLNDSGVSPEKGPNTDFRAEDDPGARGRQELHPHPVSALRVAADSVEYLGMLEPRHPGALFWWVRDDVEHVRHAWPLPRVRAPVALDVLPAMRRLVST